MRIVTLTVCLAACGEPGPPPRIEAHRAAAGYWPENSRTAVRESIAAGFEAIEVDLVLTRDQVPVLSHDPALSPERCTRSDGAPLEDEVPIRELTLARLQEEYLCGGLPDPEHRNALVVAEPPATLDELLELLREAPPELLVHLDLKQEPGRTAAPEVFAEQILGRLLAADRPQPFTVSSARPEVLRAFDAEARQLGLDVPGALLLPDFSGDRSTTAVALAQEARLLTGGLDYVAAAREASARAVSLRWELVDRTQLLAAKREGLEVHLWTVNDPDLLRALARRGEVDALITDYPGDLTTEAR